VTEAVTTRAAKSFKKPRASCGKKKGVVTTIRKEASPNEEGEADDPSERFESVDPTLSFVSMPSYRTLL
jgi:hypothetical protein